jgi:hypothetical protein
MTLPAASARGAAISLAGPLKRWRPKNTRQGRLNKPDLRRLLGFATSDQIDTFLKAHEIWIDYTIEDLERERAGLRRLGF